MQIVSKFSLFDLYEHLGFEIEFPIFNLGVDNFWLLTTERVQVSALHWVNITKLDSDCI